MNGQRLLDGAAGVEVREMLRGVVSHEIANKFTTLALNIDSIKESAAQTSASQKINEQAKSIMDEAALVQSIMVRTRDKLSEPGVKPSSVFLGSNLSSNFTRLHNKFSEIRRIALNGGVSEIVEAAARNVLNMRRALEVCEDLVGNASLDGEWETIAPNRLKDDIISSVDYDNQSGIDVNLGSTSFVGIRRQIITALSNYLTNAKNHSGANKIEVRRSSVIWSSLPSEIRSTERKVKKNFSKNIREWNVFSVRNNGNQIPDEHLEAIWKFNIVLKNGQPTSTRDTDESEERLAGRGLGLTLAKYAAELHGGNVWVRNNAGGGTTFYFIIPAKKPKHS